MEEKNKVLIILGTAREGNKTQIAADYLKRELYKRDEVETDFISPRDLNMAVNDEANIGGEVFKQKAGWADAFVIVAPEYNHGYPGSLKMMLDLLAPEGELHRKPVALASTSSGIFGGVRFIESILPVLREFGMVISSEELLFPRIQDFFDESGNPKEPKANDFKDKFINELLWLSGALKKER